jgi:LPS export ABC transporter permease LptG/LPS export ABC transporter permease LptF
MKRLHKLLYREIAGPCWITLVVLTFVVFTREFGRLAELLIRRNADTFTVLRIVAYILPNVLVFSIPFAFLIGTLIGFGRLSGDSEVVAMRANGVGTFQMVWPVLKVGAAVAVTTSVFTMFLLPQGNWNLRKLSHELRVIPIQSEIKPRLFNEDIPGTILYIEDIDLRTFGWKGVFVHRTEPGGERRIVLAKSGELVVSEDGRRLQLHLEDGSVYESSYTSPETDKLTRFATQDLMLPPPETEPPFAKPKRPKDKNVWELWRDAAVETGTKRPDQAELHSRFSLPLATLLFAILGVTLGATTHKVGRGYGFFVSMVVAFVYFVLFDMGKRLAAEGEWSVWTGVWGVDGLVGAAALITFRKASSNVEWLRGMRESRALLGLSEIGSRLKASGGELFSGMAIRLARAFWGFCTICIQVTRVIDLYMVRSFFFYFLPTLLVCVALFYLFTFFELTDEVAANRITYRLVFDYFFYLGPHILLLLVPISILITTLLTLGVMDKTNQVVAFKSCGVSVYRLAVPVVVVSAALGGLLFAMQEWVSPYANQRQEQLRNIIKGRPVQTSYQLGRNWIFGEDNRLFNYGHFNAESHLFADLSVFEIDIAANRLVSHTHARLAKWDPQSGKWTLSDGWRRRFDNHGDGFENFKEGVFSFSETPSYFAQEVKESSKMTYVELREHIQGLQRAGFEVDQLKTELYKKVSFPVVNLIMTLLGVPFAFSMGRKGALVGIALGVLLGIFYWGLFGVFGVLGANGLLAPALAAWGPNIVFGATALLMLSEVRT